ncbi:MAG: flippase-like domain-containing protein [Desulfobacterales bacterium]|nr:flippase-like domain-containing protein [Desulfobacterales bacterium]
MIPRMRKVRLVIGWVIGVLAVAFCIGAAAKYWGEFTRYHTGISVRMLIVGLACMLAGNLSKAAGWFVLMSGIGSPIRFLTALRSWSYSQVAGYVPGKVHVFFVRMQVCQEDGALPSKVFTGTAVEIILSLVSSLTIWFLSSPHTPASREFLQIWYLAPLILMLATLHPKAIMTLMGLYYRLRGISEQEVPQMKLANILRPGGLYCLGWLLYGFGGYFILRSVVSCPIGPAPSAVGVAGTFTFAWAVGYMFFISPGGLGAREGALIWGLGAWAPTGVAVVVSLLARLCQGSLALGFAGTWWAVHHWRKLRISAKGRHNSVSERSASR